MTLDEALRLAEKYAIRELETKVASFRRFELPFARVELGGGLLPLVWVVREWPDEEGEGELARTSCHLDYAIRWGLKHTRYIRVSEYSFIDLETDWTEEYGHGLEFTIRVNEEWSFTWTENVSPRIAFAGLDVVAGNSPWGMLVDFIQDNTTDLDLIRPLLALVEEHNAEQSEANTETDTFDIPY